MAAANQDLTIRLLPKTEEHKEPESLLRYNLRYGFKEFGLKLADLVRQRVLSVSGVRILDHLYPNGTQIGSVTAEVVGPAFSMLSTLVDTLSPEVSKYQYSLDPQRDLILSALDEEDFTQLFHTCFPLPTMDIEPNLKAAFDKIKNTKAPHEKDPSPWKSTAFTPEEAEALEKFLRNREGFNEKILEAIGFSGPRERLKYQKTALSFFHWMIAVNTLVNIPFGLLPVGLMPNLFKTPVSLECRLLAIAATLTGVSRSTAVFSTALGQKRQTQNLILKILFQELPLIGLSFLAIQQRNFLLLTLFQISATGLGVAANYMHIRRGLRALGCVETGPERVSLTRKKVWKQIKSMVAGLPGSVGDSVVRLLFIFLLELKKNADAATSFYYLMYQIYFTAYGLTNPFAKSLAYAARNPDYQPYARENEKWVVISTSAISLVTGIATYISSKPLIEFLNPPENPKAIHANDLMATYFPLLFGALLFQGAALTYLNKIMSVHKKRLLGGLLDNLPQLLVVLAVCVDLLISRYCLPESHRSSDGHLSPENMVAMLLASWLGGDLLSIIVGRRLPVLPPQKEKNQAHQLASVVANRILLSDERDIEASLR
jgi:hypothetical protein